ncbi:MAG TPA: transcription termination factor NusA [Actinomycetes bacterium]|nr:transcription termination factor NusA [Actinomycetes bacterium]
MRIPIDELRFLEREKGIALETVIGALETALAAAYKRQPNAPDEARVVVDRGSGEITVWAQELDEDGQVVREWEDTPSDFGRVAAVTAKQVITQRLREAERDLTYGEYEGRVGDVVTGIVQQRDPRHVTVDLGRVEADLPHAEQVPSEHYQHNDRIKVYIVDVTRSARGLRVVASRTHPNLVRRLFEMEVPELDEGIVEITNVAREPGHRTKIAVRSNDPAVDPKGACVGARGSRVRMVVNELRGEKIDIVLHADDPAEFVAEALSPAKVQRVMIDEAERTAHVTVPDYQLSLAIGKEGQNARLAARLTGWRIDIRSDRADDQPRRGDRVYEPGAGRGARSGGSGRPGRQSALREA